MNFNFLESNDVINLRHFLSINDFVGTILGGTINLLLIYILYKMDKHEISNYKRILYLVTITDFLLALSNSIVMMSMETYHGYILTFTDGISFLIPNKIWNYSCIFFHMTLFQLTFCNICITFFYRYLIIIHNYKMTNSQFYTTIFCLILWHSLSLIILSFCIIPSNDPNYNNLIKLFENSYKNELEEYGREVIILNIFLIYGLIYNFHLLSTSFITVTIIYYSFYKIRQELRSQKSSMSSKSISLQNQLNIVMFCHALVPMFLAFIPILIFEASDYFQFNIKGLGTLLFFSIEWVPFVNGLISLTMITACRRKFLKIIRFKCNDNSSHVISLQQQRRISNIHVSSFAG
uniref:G-protein coupled receptors family 1 profile domain-containing protein n=1 Tax=Strongyloides stercoralis TaxID=6248 RepID=A0A0K0DZA6_STRER